MARAPRHSGTYHVNPGMRSGSTTRVYVSISRSTSGQDPASARATNLKRRPSNSRVRSLNCAGAGDDLLGHVWTVGDVVGACPRVTAGGERDGERAQVAQPPGRRGGGVGEVATARLDPGEGQRDRQPGRHRAAQP